MTTIILTIIGILLAAVAALMVIFYGGDAFTSSSTGAHANTLQNAGTNVISAVSLYKAENGSAPATLAALTPSYLKDSPATAGAATGAQSFDGVTYSVAGVSDEVCAKINTNLGVTPADLTSNKMGCLVGTADDNTFFANA